MFERRTDETSTEPRSIAAPIRVERHATSGATFDAIPTRASPPRSARLDDESPFTDDGHELAAQLAALPWRR
jgi:hypothetical protein